MFLLVGLGNPGSGYARHRHNVGFMALDAIAHQYGAGPWKSKFQGRMSEARIGRHKVLLLKPDTYMNLSGQSVQEACHFHKIESDCVFVFHDDLDLAPAKLRIKLGGGHGGHNGLRSIDAHLGPDYHRVRIGIGHPGRKEMVNGYVLQDFSSEDQKWLPATLESLAKELELLLSGDEAEYLNRVTLATRDVLKPADAKEKPAGKVTRSGA